MIISHRFKFIFIKTIKTAGTSIEVYLSGFCGLQDVLTPIRPPVPAHEPRNFQGFVNPLKDIQSTRGKRINKIIVNFLTREKFYNHIPAYLVRSRVSAEIWNNYFKFCVERNPWDKTLSHYFMIKKQNNECISLDKYLEGKKYCINYPLYMDPMEKNIIVDRVLRYETLDQELSEVCDMLNIPFDGSLAIYAKSQYRDDRSPYQDVITRRQWKMIEQIFEKEINLHGYKF